MCLRIDKSGGFEYWSNYCYMCRGRGGFFGSMRHAYSGDTMMADEVQVPGAPADAQQADTWLAAAAAALARGELEAAWQAGRQAAQAAPLHAPVYDALSAVLEAQGQGREALAHRMAALALRHGSALQLYNIATAYLMAGLLEPAEAWYRLTLQLDPELPMAHRNFATLLRDTGRAAQAQRHTEAAYRRQYVFTNQCAAPQRTVWMICAGARGNVPLDLWFSRAHTQRVEFFIEYVPPGGPATPAQLLQAQGCAAPDLIFNAIGDADIAAPVFERMQAFVAAASVPVLNAPAAVAATARDRLPQHLAGIAGLLAPPVTRVHTAAQAQACLDAAGAPVLVRPVATHGGEGLVLVEQAQQLATLDWQAAAYFVAPYHDYRSADGCFRKYRVIFIDRQPYPYHLAISTHWLVHYFSADMLGQAGKQAEEARFLADPVAVLGAPAWQALHEVGARLALDYAGIDFALLADGRVLVFEANATMLVHREPPGSQLAYKNAYVQTLQQAFAAMVQRRLAAFER
jgi:tetratricopeptide (TPR) repeat protein